VSGNVGFGAPDADPEAIQHAAQLAGADEFVTRLPEGYETILGERGLSLSGGQRQRIAIARAILADPQVLILDDATSAVDATKEHEIRAALAQVMAGRTTLVIAHRPATIALADRVAVVDGGRVVEEGTHAELLARSALYRALLALAESEVAA
jgi:ATP-binding cassette, subfamily B, bacterial